MATKRRLVKVNNRIKEVIDTVTPGAAVWGSITGTLSSQTDLNNALNGKFTLASDDTDDITQGAVNLFNQTHTGEVTGATALSLNKTAISNRTAVTPVAGDYILIGDTSDSDNLKKVLASDLAALATVTAATTAQIDAQTDNTLMATPLNLNGSRYDVAAKLYLFYNY